MCCFKGTENEISSYRPTNRTLDLVVDKKSLARLKRKVGTKNGKSERTGVTGQDYEMVPASAVSTIANTQEICFQVHSGLSQTGVVQNTHFTPV